MRGPLRALPGCEPVSALRFRRHGDSGRGSDPTVIGVEATSHEVVDVEVYEDYASAPVDPNAPPELVTLPVPQVMFDSGRHAPPGGTHMLVFVAPLDDLAVFAEHWRFRHGPIYASLPWVRNNQWHYHQYHVPPSPRRMAHARFAGIVHHHFPNDDVFDEYWSTPDYFDVVRPDEIATIDRANTRWLIADDPVLYQ